MSTKEQAEQPDNHGGEAKPYFRAARLRGEKPAGRAYNQAQEAIYRAPECDLSVYRLILEQRWHVAVLGQPPAEHLDRRIRKILSRGEPASPPEEILRELARRRARATKLGPWVERHLRPE